MTVGVIKPNRAAELKDMKRRLSRIERVLGLGGRRGDVLDYFRYWCTASTPSGDIPNGALQKTWTVNQVYAQGAAPSRRDFAGDQVTGIVPDRDGLWIVGNIITVQSAAPITPGDVPDLGIEVTVRADADEPYNNVIDVPAVYVRREGDDLARCIWSGSFEMSARTAHCFMCYVRNNLGTDAVFKMEWWGARISKYRPGVLFGES